MIPSSRILDDVREKIASKFMVLCEDCGHGKNLKDDCPHLDEDVCMWQRELANDTLALSGTTDIECPVCNGNPHIECSGPGKVEYKWKVSVVLENGELPRNKYNSSENCEHEAGFFSTHEMYDVSQQNMLKAKYKQVVE